MHTLTTLSASLLGRLKPILVCEGSSRAQTVGCPDAAEGDYESVV
jgi:hypothetical protein